MDFPICQAGAELMNLEVHVGHAGWLFLSGGSNEVLKYYNEPGFFDQAKEYWLHRFRSRIEKSKKLDCEYRHMIVPDKLSIYPEFYTAPLAFPNAVPSIALRQFFSEQLDAAELLSSLLDVRDPMLAAKTGGNPLYWRTDAHWTFEGCHVAYLELCRSVGAKPKSEILTAPTGSAMLVLDLGSKLKPPVQEEYFVKYFLRDAERYFANDLILFKERENAHDAPGLHVGSHICFRNKVSPNDNRTIVLFGDSYSEYRTHQLTGLLAETFAETHFIWSSNIDWHYVQSVGADIVVTEMAERFMNLVPSDDFDIEKFARQRLGDFLASRSSS
jgi:hypothetical protein